MSVNHSARAGNITGIFSVFFNIKVCCVFLLESLHQGNSNEYTQYTFFNIVPNLHLLDFSKGLKNKFETAMVNEPSVFEPLKFYCTLDLTFFENLQMKILLSASWSLKSLDKR